MSLKRLADDLYEITARADFTANPTTGGIDWAKAISRVGQEFGLKFDRAFYELLRIGVRRLAATSRLAGTRHTGYVLGLRRNTPGNGHARPATPRSHVARPSGRARAHARREASASAHARRSVSRRRA